MRATFDAAVALLDKLEAEGKGNLTAAEIYENIQRYQEKADYFARRANEEAEVFTRYMMELEQELAAEAAGIDLYAEQE
jgi:hypothetical protein